MLEVGRQYPFDVAVPLMLAGEIVGRDLHECGVGHLGGEAVRRQRSIDVGEIWRRIGERVGRVVVPQSPRSGSRVEDLRAYDVLRRLPGGPRLLALSVPRLSLPVRRRRLNRRFEFPPCRIETRDEGAGVTTSTVNGRKYDPRAPAPTKPMRFSSTPR